MVNKQFPSIIFLALLFFVNCSSATAPKKSLSGSYTVNVEIKDLNINKDQIQNSIKEGMQSMKSELNSDKVKSELSTENIDTSTVEGKIEYAAKNFAKGMSGFGEMMAQLGTDLSSLSLSAIDGLFDQTNGLTKNMNADVELKEDGSVKITGNPILKFIAAQLTWDLEGDYFILKNDKGEVEQKLLISDKTSEGFILSNEGVKLVLKKKAMKI